MPTIKKSLDSILNQVSGRYEVVIVDAKNTDGSLDVLRNYRAKGKLRLFVERSSRGRGRQLAFEHSSGKYIWSNINLDEVYPDDLLKKLSTLEPYAEDRMIMVNDRMTRSNSHGFTLATRKIILSLGGWKI